MSRTRSVALEGGLDPVAAIVAARQRPHPRGDRDGLGGPQKFRIPTRRVRESIVTVLAVPGPNCYPNLSMRGEKEF
ncbi:MAG: hypothetical protein PHQ28_04340 [Mycobacterium sp.]|nr:hypothetical protein [Mycobacterium sp.]